MILQEVGEHSKVGMVYVWVSIISFEVYFIVGLNDLSYWLILKVLVVRKDVNLRLVFDL